jgi:proline iminopeptidase
MTTFITSQVENRRPLNDPFEPYFKGFLDVGKPEIGHRLYYECSGNPEGIPVLVSHGGPGGGVADYYRQYFDKNVWRVIMFDQRGAGKSTPFADLRDNTTWDTVADMEKIRETLKIDKWALFGGSWGSCISITYAETHPTRTLGLVLRGIFTLRRSELEWFYQTGSGGVENCFPDAMEKLCEPIPAVERGDIMGAYYRRLTGSDEGEKLRCARAWSMFEMSTSKLFVDPKYIARGEDDKFALAFARIETHYFVHGGFFKYDGQLIKEATILEEHSIPGIVVQGRYDMVCPMKSAYELKQNWPSSELIVVPDGGHSCTEKGTISELCNATDKMAKLITGV